MIAWVPIVGGALPQVPDSAPYWIVLLESYVPVFAAFVVTIVLARTGFSQKLNEYRKETVELIRLRSEALEKQVAETQGENIELQKEIRRKDRRIEDLEGEVYDLRAQVAPRRPPSSRAAPARPAAPETDEAPA